MMRRFCLVVGLWLMASVSQAYTFQQCGKSQQSQIIDALKGAQKLVLGAAVTVGDTPEYARWFGKYSQPNAERVRANFKAIYRAMATGNVKGYCGRQNEMDCTGDTYAFVQPDDPFVVYLCPNFFGQITMSQFEPDTPQIENGTREGTLVHEMSHFLDTANTDDNCYSRGVCTDMALTDAQSAIQNADSYQYFAEDIAFFVRSKDN